MKSMTILAALLFLTLDADGKASKCKVAFKECSDTAYDAIIGKNFRIDCTVAFCNNTLQTVSWYKLENAEYVPVNASSSHIETEWECLNPKEWRSYLVFQNLLRSDAGVYQCQGKGRGSHEITVYAIDYFWPYVYRIAGFTVFVILMLTVCVASRCRCKGKSGDTPSRQHSHDALPATHIYDNDP